ncbi:hypothetical protein [Flavicella sp.]|uniref:hypothetical protein n=1 Tax=Flavicella sp. TaxID=2957742 RepID=UPI0030165786
MKKLFMLLMVTLVISSCNDDDIDLPDYHYEYLPIEEAIIPSTFTLNETYDITITYILPNECYSFNSVSFEIDQEDETSRILAVLTLVDDVTTCTEELITEEYTFEFTATQEEEYTFKLWKGYDDEGESIFDEIIVPVVPVVIDTSIQELF